MSIRSRIFQGIAANGFGQIANILIQVVSIPIFIGIWGVELYGEWLILSVIATYLANSDIGFSTVAANEMTMQVSREDRSGALVTFNSTWVFITSISAFLGIVLLSVIFILPIEQWFRFKHQTHSEIITVIVFLTLHVLAGLQARLMIVAFRSDGKYALGIFLANILRLSEFGSLAAAVYLGATPVVAAEVFLVVHLIGVVGIRMVLARQIPWIVYDHRKATLKMIKILARPAVTFMALPVGMMIRDQGIVTIIGIALGPVAVPVFTTVRTVVNAGYQLMNMINHSVWPEISIAFGAKDMELVKKLHRRAFSASFWLALLFVIAVYFFGEWIISIWTMGKIVPEPIFFLLMLMSLFVEVLWTSSSIVTYAINEHEKLTIYYLCMAGLSLLIAVSLVPLVQLRGAAIALLTLNICMGLVATRMALKLLKDNAHDFIHALLVSPLTFYQLIRRGF